jgi:hypothetical protein
MNGVCFFVNMLSLENRMIQFPKLDCSVLADLAYASLNFNCRDPPIMCITYYMFTHTKLLYLSDA